MRLISRSIPFVLVGAMAASFVLPLSAHAASSSTGSASAQSPAGSSTSVTLTDDELKDRLESLVDQAADFASVSEADKSLYVHRVESEVADRQIALSAISSADLKWADSTVLENNSDVRMVRVPAPQAKGDLSAVMILLGSNNSMSVIEHKFTPVSTTAMRLQLWADGSLKMDKIADSATQTVVDSSAWKPAGDMTAQFSWGKFNDCLASKGIPWTVVALLSTACGVACAITLGVGCAVCISAAGSISIATVEYCIRTN